LEDDELVEEGYTRRDLALATLVAFHHFNIEAVLHDPLQRRRMSFVSDDGKEEVSLTLFPGLQDYQFEAILHYAHTERWPFRAEGLFLEIKQSQTPYDPTLLEAFWITSEFHLLETLFKRTNPLLAREDLLQLIIEGEWQIVSEFVKKGIGSESEAIVLRNELLTQYLNARSKTAAKLILISDEEYALKRLDDHQVVILLDLISERGQEVETFIRSLLTSKRSDEVWKKAAKKFYDWLGETLPDPYDHRVVLYRLFPNLLQKKESVTPKETLKKKRIHIVTERENLWKISRKYKVSIEELKKINHLESEKLKPGQQLEIP